MSKIVMVNYSWPERSYWKATMGAYLYNVQLSPSSTIPDDLENSAAIVLDWKLGKLDGFEEARKIVRAYPRLRVVLRTGYEDDRIAKETLTHIDYVIWKDGAGGDIGRIYTTPAVMTSLMGSISPPVNVGTFDQGILWQGPMQPMIKVHDQQSEPFKDWKQYEAYGAVVLTGPKAYHWSQMLKVCCKKPLSTCVLTSLHPSTYPNDGLDYANYIGFPNGVYAYEAVLRAWQRRYR